MSRATGASQNLHITAWFDYTVTDNSTQYIINVTSAGLQSNAWGYTFHQVSARMRCTGSSEESYANGIDFYSGEAQTVSVTCLSNMRFTIPKTESVQNITVSLIIGVEPGYWGGVWYYERLYTYAYASFTVNPYTYYAVSYNANGGSNAPAAGKKIRSVAYTISTITPIREGFKFLGWATSSSATSPTYASGATYTTDAALSLYAVWESLYNAPLLNNVTLVRCTDTGVPKSDGTYANASLSFTAKSSKYLIFTFYRKQANSTSESLVLTKTVKYFGTREWSQSDYDTYGAIGYSGTFNQTTGYEHAVSIGDYLLIDVYNTTDSKYYKLMVEATSTSTISTHPTGKVVARTVIGQTTAPTIMSASITFLLGNDDFDADYRYTIRIRIQDGTSDNSLSYLLPAKYKPLDIANGGRSFGFGKDASDTESRIDFGMNLYDINEKLIFGDGLTSMVTSPSTLNQIKSDGQLHYFNISGSSTTNRPSFTDGSILHFGCSSNNNNDAQLAISNGVDPVKIETRSQLGSANSWGNWIHLLTSSDDGSVLAHGTSGTNPVWEYWKLANGLAICIGQYTFSNFNMTTAYGYVYYTGWENGFNYPFDFSDVPYTFANTEIDGILQGIYNVSLIRNSSDAHKRLYAYIWGPYQQVNKTLRVNMLAVGPYA